MIGAQLAMTALVAVIAGLVMRWSDALPVLFGAALGILATLLIKRSADRVMGAAERNPRHAFAALFSGLVLRYAVVILGLLVGFRVLQLAAVPLISGFVLMIIVQAAASMFASRAAQPGIRTKG